MKIKHAIYACNTFALILAPLVSISAPSLEQWQNLYNSTHEHTLTNGLRIILREDHRAPISVFQLWYRVGSSYEPTFQTGISHVLEHMMFKGTHSLAPGELSKWVAKFGGQENAFTSYDFTGYYQVWSPQYLELSFALEADRMRNLSFPPKEFEKELNVVKEERRQRTDDNPISKTYERFAHHALPGNPYQTPIVGWMHDLEQLTLADTQAWYHRWYHPNNSLIVIVGALPEGGTPESLFELAERYFGNIPAGNIPYTPPPKTLPNISNNTLKVSLPAKVPTLYMGFNVPSLKSPEVIEKEPYTLLLLSALLDAGYSSRLQQTLVRDQKVASTVASHYSPFRRGDTLLVISATPTHNTSLDTLQTALWTTLKSLKKNPASTRELKKVKAQLFSQLIYQQDSLQHQASQIGQYASLGLPWDSNLTLMSIIEDISPEDIQTAAKRYLIADHATIAELIPSSLGIE